MPNLKNRKSRKFSHNFLDREAREEGRAREERLYGDLLPYVVYLRKMGWVVFKEGLNYRIGTKLRDHWGLMDVYFRVKERESRSLSAQLGEDMDTKGPQRKTKRSANTGTRNASGSNRRSPSAGNQEQVARGGNGRAR